MTSAPVASAVRTVHSADGTPISYLSTGSGPGLLVVPGALTDAGNYAALATALGANFTVHTIQRRARPGSGPQGDRYSMDTECADLAAVVAATGARYVFGHSYGGLIALEAARRDSSLTKLALYEPGVSVDGLFPTGWMPRYRQFLRQGRPFDAFAVFAAATGPAMARRNPRWLMAAILRLVLRGRRRATILSLLEANLHEHEQVARLDDSYPNYRDVKADVLLMAGGRTGVEYFPPAFQRLMQVLPSARLHTFPKLNHFGPDQKGPAEVARTVTAFLRG